MYAAKGFENLSFRKIAITFKINAIKKTNPMKPKSKRT